MRAEALVLLAELESGDRSVALLEDALAQATSRPALQSMIHGWLAWARRFRDGFVRALDHARAALGLADELDDDALRVERLTQLATLGCLRRRHRGFGDTQRGRTTSRTSSVTPSC